jgi:putative glycosyltransferase (TIGR04348 family)
MSSGAKPRIVIVTPGTRAANNGNWRTALRWSRLLSRDAKVILQTGWSGEHADLLIALHAKRSAEAVASFRRSRPDVPVIAVLSGTDLYRDLPGSPEARRTLEIADRIVALQGDAPSHLPAALAAKCRVIYQSARPLPPAAKPSGRLDCVVVGHLRAEKDPLTVMRALPLLAKNAPVTIRHIGAALDPSLAAAARRAARSDSRYRWVGALPHGLARAAIKSAHLLVHPSIMEGGANVIVEAVTSGTPVLASRISGNVGMLGENYPGYFEVGDASALASSLIALLDRPALLRVLCRAAGRRAALFTPERERLALLELVTATLRKARG